MGEKRQQFIKWVSLTVSMNKLTPSNAEAHCMYFGQCSYHLQFILISTGMCALFFAKDFRSVCIHCERNFFYTLTFLCALKMLYFRIASLIPQAIFKSIETTSECEKHSEPCMYVSCSVARRTIFLYILFYFKRMLMFDVFFMQFSALPWELQIRIGMALLAV